MTSNRTDEGAQTASARPPARAPSRSLGNPEVLLLLSLVGAMLLLRLATLGSYPLMDTSEARYGEIARVMLVTGNWVTPQEVPGTPFWAKPPLYAWFAVASMKVLGVNEFALRLPSFFCALLVLALCVGWSNSLGGVRSPNERTRAALLTLGILSTSVLFFVSAGAVMTDPTLAVCTTWMLAAFHHCAIRASRVAIWRWGFFVAAGLGMLAKGPVILLYVGAPIALWTLWQRRFAGVWHALPWFWGAVLTAAICVPWYWLAEERTPGFLRYFLLGEHVMRFLKPGWGGDLYGTAHAEPLGMIWAYLAGALGLGVVLVVAAALGAAREFLGGIARNIDAEHRFLLLASLVPILFFTFAGNVIWTYVLPTLPPLAVLVAGFLAARWDRSLRWRAAVYGTLGASGLCVAIAIIAWVPRHVAKHSSAALAAQWRERAGPVQGEIAYLGRKAPASLRFYSAGSVRTVTTLAEAMPASHGAHDWYVALAPDRVGEVRQFANTQPGVWSVETIGANTDLALVRVHPGALSAP
ncbi:MAG TPA: glycosyltransferase family 39 protein [Burkholderiaceae bacterium]|nr:glycosyltransferase family 39 protein [Burkholderiaceae bacterium]